MARGLGVEEHSAGFAVVEKLLLEAEQGGTSREAVTLMDVIHEVGGDGIEYPGDDHTIHSGPRRVARVDRIAEDMLLQREAAEDEEEMAAPFGVVGGLEIQNNRN
jgi:hypothetical protein